MPAIAPVSSGLGLMLAFSMGYNYSNTARASLLSQKVQIEIGRCSCSSETDPQDDQQRREIRMRIAPTRSCGFEMNERWHDMPTKHDASSTKQTEYLNKSLVVTPAGSPDDHLGRCIP